MARQEDVLTRTPSDWRIFYNDPCRVVWERYKACFASESTVWSAAVKNTTRTEEVKVLGQNVESSQQAIEEEDANRQPYVNIHLHRSMDEYEAEKKRERDEMLKNKDLVGETSNWRDRADIDPDEDSPCGNAFPNNLVVLELIANVVVRSP